MNNLYSVKIKSNRDLKSAGYNRPFNMFVLTKRARGQRSKLNETGSLNQGRILKQINIIKGGPIYEEFVSKVRHKSNSGFEIFDLNCFGMLILQIPIFK